MAREAVAAAKLPNRRPERSWGGPGAGVDCPICGTPVRRDEFEFELEFVRSGAAPGHDIPGPDIYHLHGRCFTAWQSERDQGGPPQAAAASRQGREIRDAP